MRLKKRVGRRIVAFVCSFLLCGFATCSSLDLAPKKTLDSASASGFTDVTGLPNPIVSLEFVYSDNSTVSHVFASDELDPYNKGVENGFSVFDLISSISGNPLYNCVSFYMALNFDVGMFNSAKYDLFLSSKQPVWNTQVYDSNFVLLTAWLEDFLLPMDIFRLAKVTVSNTDQEILPFRNVVFRFDGYFFRNMLSMYQQGYYDYYCFAYDMTDNSDYINAYNSGYNNGYDIGIDEGYTLGYGSGKTDGESIGYENGFDVGLETGYNNGFSIGSSQGYNNGYAAALNEGGFANLISAVIDVPVNAMFGLLSFDLFGVNIANVLMSLFTLSIVLWILKKFVI